MRCTAFTAGTLGRVVGRVVGVVVGRVVGAGGQPIPGLYAAGDHRDTASIQGAVVSGARVAELARTPAHDGGTRLVLVLHEAADEGLSAVPGAELAGASEVLLVVGPEGGISAEELELIGGTPVKLGPEVLRTASAAMVALAAIGMRTERW